MCHRRKATTTTTTKLKFALYYVFYHQPVYTGIVLVTLFTLFDLNCHAKIKSMPQKFCNLWTVSHFRQNCVILKIEWSPEFVTIIKNMTRPFFLLKIWWRLVSMPQSYFYKWTKKRNILILCRAKKTHFWFGFLLSVVMPIVLAVWHGDRIIAKPL